MRTEIVRTCVDVVSNYMYQSDNFFVVVQPSDKLLATKVFITTTLSFFVSRFVYKHSSIFFEILDNLLTSNKLESQRSCITLHLAGNL